MTAAQSGGLPAADSPPTPSLRVAASSGCATTVVVLTYLHAGGRKLHSMLAEHPDLACTTGKGILPLCEQAADTWRDIEGRPDRPLSALAAASTRALTASMITAVLSRTGKRRWCELATAPPRVAETFLQLYPATRVVCLYRSCPDVIHAVLAASPWGLSGPTFAPYTSAHPASTVAALTAYWVERTESLLAFEQNHADTCLRVRYEDLTAVLSDDVRAFLCLEDLDLGMPSWPVHDTVPPTDANKPGPRMPVMQIPPTLLAKANTLLLQLDYPPLVADS